VPERVARRPVFTLGGRTFTWGDLVALARLDGSWAEVEQAARDGVAGLRRAEAAGRRPTSEEVTEATTRFRYARGLLAGDELHEWLERWALTAADWRGYVERDLVRAPGGADDDVADTVWAEAACSGFVERTGARIAGERALELAGGAGDVTRDVIAHEVALHRLEWLRLEGHALNVQLEGTAREAALCVREDGRSLADVAGDCDTEVEELDAYAGDLDPELSSVLVGAAEGELVGPVRRGEGFSLVLVERKTPPSPDDPEARRRAEERLRRRAVERAVLEHVEWHERL
jgi:hypothetical protein